MNSSKFIENIPISASGNLYRHANPFELNYPIPCSHASETVVSVGLVKAILFMSIPLVLTYWIRVIHKWIFLVSCLFGTCDPNCLQRLSKFFRHLGSS